MSPAAMALFDLAIDSKLRGCDLVALRLNDLMTGGSVRRRGLVLQQKTSRPVQFEITEQPRQSVRNWLNRRGERLDDWLFPSRQFSGAHLSTRQYSRLLKQWVDLLGLEPSAYGTHSLRRTKVSLLYKPAISGPASCSSATLSSKAQSAILASNSTMRLRCPRRWKSESRLGVESGPHARAGPLGGSEFGQCLA